MVNGNEDGNERQAEEKEPRSGTIYQAKLISKLHTIQAAEMFRPLEAVFDFFCQLLVEVVHCSMNVPNVCRLITASSKTVVINHVAAANVHTDCYDVTVVVATSAAQMLLNDVGQSGMRLSKRDVREPE